MTIPSKIVGFLRVFTLGPEKYPGWDPSLILVMAGAIVVAIVPIQYIIRKRDDMFPAQPLLFPQEPRYQSWLQPKSWSKHPHKAQSILGALMFGSGWVCSGLCPGPALVLAGGGSPAVICLFMPPLILGTYVGLKFQCKTGIHTEPVVNPQSL